MSLALTKRQFVGGAFISSDSAEPIINPATEAVIGEAPLGTLEDAESAIEAAHQSFRNGTWRRMNASERVAAMQRFYDYLDKRSEEICELIVAEAGATIGLARAAQWGLPMKHFRYQLAIALHDQTTMSTPEITPMPNGHLMLGTSAVHRDPVGVVSAITPYNYPFMLNLAKIVPALLMGNSIVLKPSPYTPFEALLLGEAAIAAGLPGAAIMAQAAPTLKRVLLELGGKSAMIVRADADLDRAAGAGLGGFTSHCGQGCALLTRHIVHNSVRKEYVARLKAMADRVKVGDPADPSTMMGPLIREAQRSRVEHYVQTAVEAGATLVTGGRRPPDLDKGFFFEPTFFDNVDNASELAQDEVFGPVGAVIGYDSDEEAIALTNDSRFGLSGAIFSADSGLAYEMASEIRSGGVSINGGAGTMLSDAPFGGNARSGYGRENGMEGLLEYTNSKSVSFHAA